MLMMLPYMLASIVPAVSTAAMVFARRNRAAPPASVAITASEPEAAPLPISFHTEATDVRAIVVGGIEALAERARAARVRIGFAVETGLICVVAPEALKAALTEAIGGAIQGAPGGAVLVSAGRHGGRVRITVVDDGDRPDEAAITARLRPATEALALCGTSVQVRARAGHGVTVELRVPDFAQTAHAPPAHAVARQATSLAVQAPQARTHAAA